MLTAALPMTSSHPAGQIFQFASGLSSHYATLDYQAIFERGAQLSGDGSFRYAARTMSDAMARQNVTVHSMVADPKQGPCETPLSNRESAREH